VINSRDQSVACPVDVDCKKFEAAADPTIKPAISVKHSR
jgi:hypothetical protein